MPQATNLAKAGRCSRACPVVGGSNGHHAPSRWARHTHFLLLATVTMALVLSAPTRAQIQASTPPAVDHHQHLFSPAAVALTTGVSPVDANDLIRLLDEAGIQRAVVLSLAYQFGNPNRPPVNDEYAHVKAENDWTSRQVARFPERLRGFCSVNPLKSYALGEIDRCAGDPQLRGGLKLHFGNSDVDLDQPAHVAVVREVFRAANAHRMPIVVHLRPSVTRSRPYGARQARRFVDEVLSAAPDITVQIAHLAGAGGYDDPAIDEALNVFIAAIDARDSRMVNVYFDVSGIAGLGQWEEKARRIVEQMRRLGTRRLLYGSDGNAELLKPRDAWATFRRLPLSESEFDAIARNTAPFLR